MSTHHQPITIYVADAARAKALAAADKDSRAMLSGAGTLSFHLLIAQHGAGEFKTLYVPMALRGKFALPAGGKVFTEEGE